MNLTPGTALRQRYAPIAPADDRGAGEAWRALDLARGQREVTLSLYGPGSAAAAARLDAAARAAAHPSLARPLDVGAEGGRAFAAYEPFAGASLGAHLDAARARGEPPPLAWVRAVFDAASAAVEALHAAGVAHGALSPASVLVGGAAFAVCVVDAGLGCFARAAATPGAARASACAAPELAAGAEPDAASDVYALGALLREALDGRADVADAVGEAAALATAHDPAGRFGSVAALRAALAGEWELGDALESPTVMSPAPTESPPAARRHGGTALAEDVGIGESRGAAFAGTMIADVDQRLARVRPIDAPLDAGDFARELPSAAATPSLPPPAPRAPTPAPPPPAPPAVSDDRGRAVAVAAIAIIALAGAAMIAWALLHGGRAS
ncbi:MAG: hypothetical protein U0324_10915 [Polyangiales bacterium]